MESVISTGFAHCAAISNDNKLYMWGSIDDNTKNEKLPKEVEIVHNGEVFIPKQVACGHRFTMVVATPQKKDKKIGNSDSISDDDHEMVKMPSSFDPRPSIDAHRNETELGFIFLRRIFKHDQDDEDAGLRRYQNIEEVFSENPQSLLDKRPPERLVMPIFYENKRIPVDKFTKCLENLVKKKEYKEMAEKFCIQDKYYIKEFVNNLIYNGEKSISLAELDKAIFGEKKTQGILFGIGKADPYVFNQEMSAKEKMERRKASSSSEESIQSDIDGSQEDRIEMNILEEDMVIKSNFYMIKFPKTTNPIKSVS